MSTGIVTRRRSAMHIDNSYGIDVIAANTNLVSKRVLKGEPYITQIVCDEGYSIYEITIKMGGVDITSTAYDPTYNMITIPSVTDDVDIDVDAREFFYITFEDPAVEAICVANWGGNYEAGKISNFEAMRVTSLGNKFLANTTITKFNELRYFTGLTTLYISGSTSSAQGAFYNCTNLVEVTIPAAPIQNITGSFVKTKVKELDFSPITYVSTTTTVARTQRISHNNTSLKSFVFPSNWKLNSSYYALYAFVYGCSALQTIDTNGCDFSAMNYNNDPQTFNGCSSLTRIIGGLPGMRNTVSLSSSPLTHDAAVELLESLGTVTSARTLTLKTSTYNTLTAEEKAIATNKGWTLDYYN